MRRRLRKQLTVLAVVSAAFGGLVALVAAFWYEPPPPPPPPPPTFADLVVGDTALFRSGPGRADLLALARNPNADAGLRAVSYAFEVSGGGEVQARLSGQTFFLPGQEKPIVAIGADVPANADAVSLRFGPPAWEPVGPEFRAPPLVVVARRGSIRDGTRATYEVKGVLANESGRDFLKVDVTALGLDAAGNILGVGKTFVGSLRARERREFTVSWPLAPGAVVARTREFAEVNVFDPAAVLLRTDDGEVPGPTPSPRSLGR